MTQFHPLSFGKPVFWQFNNQDQPELLFQIDELWVLGSKPGTKIGGRVDFEADVWTGSVWHPLFDPSPRSINGKVTMPPGYIIAELLSLPKGPHLVRASQVTRDLAAVQSGASSKVGVLLRSLSPNGRFVEIGRYTGPIPTGEVAPPSQKLPCGRPYRHYDRATGDFVYPEDDAACPYTGDQAFDKYGITVRQSNDECGRRLEDCRLRFPNVALPFRAMPKKGAPS